MWDPAAAQALAAAGAGRAVALDLGGKSGGNGAPLPVRGTVLRVSDGEFVFRGPISHGEAGHMGTAALLQVDGVGIVVHTNRIQPFDPEILRSLGVEPERQKILVVKSTVHYRAAFEPLAREIIEVDAPGLASSRLENYDFRRVPRPIHPLDLVDDPFAAGEWQTP